MDLAAPHAEEASKAARDHRSLLQQAIRKWHDAFQTRTLRILIERLKELGSITIGTACSGTDVVVYILEELNQFWQAEFQTGLKMSQAFACESNKDIANFIHTQFPDCPAVINDIVHLGSDYAPTMDGKRVRMQSVDIYVCGFSCKNRAKCNPRRFILPGGWRNLAKLEGPLPFRTPGSIRLLSVF